MGPKGVPDTKIYWLTDWPTVSRKVTLTNLTNVTYPKPYITSSPLLNDFNVLVLNCKTYFDVQTGLVSEKFTFSVIHLMMNCQDWNI
jgi:hypothetical protein